MDPFETLIKECAERTGLPLQVAADHSCSLESDGMIITLQHRPPKDDVVLFAPVLTPDEETKLPAGVLRKALEFSYNGQGTRGAFLGLFQGALILSTPLPLHGLDADLLCAQLLGFTETAQGIALELESILTEEGGYEVPNRPNGNREGASGPTIVLKV